MRETVCSKELIFPRWTTLKARHQLLGIKSLFCSNRSKCPNGRRPANWCHGNSPHQVTAPWGVEHCENPMRSYKVGNWISVTLWIIEGTTNTTALVTKSAIATCWGLHVRWRECYQNRFMHAGIQWFTYLPADLFTNEREDVTGHY